MAITLADGMAVLTKRALMDIGRGGKEGGRCQLFCIQGCSFYQMLMTVWNPNFFPGTYLG